MERETVTVYEEHPGRVDSRLDLISRKRISWSAIFVGAIIGVGLSFLLNLFGFAIGLSAIHHNHEGATNLAIGGIISIIIALVVAMGLAGYAAGYLGRLYCPRRNLGILYGFATWTVALFLGAIVAGHVSQYASNYSQGVVGAKIVMVEDSKTNGDTDEMLVASNKSSKNKKPVSKQVQDNDEAMASPGSLAAGTFLLFALFSIGAIATCAGAHLGMHCKKEL